MTVETQLNQLASQLQEQEATNAQLTDEIRECVIIRERLVHQENQLGHMQQTVMQVEVRICDRCKKRVCSQLSSRFLENLDIEICI